MKTFDSFLYESMGDKLGKMSDEDFANFQKGRTAAEAENFRQEREKARGKGGALAVRKKEKTDKLGAKPKAKEGFNKSQPPKPNRPQPTVTKKAQPAAQTTTALGAEKEKEKEKEKKDRKKLNLGIKDKLGYVAGKAKDAAVGLAKTDTSKEVQTYAAQ